MALVGKWTQYESKESETETQIVKISYPAELPEDHPEFEKAGTEEEIEVGGPVNAEPDLSEIVGSGQRLEPIN